MTIDEDRSLREPFLLDDSGTPTNGRHVSQQPPWLARLSHSLRRLWRRRPSSMSSKPFASSATEDTRRYGSLLGRLYRYPPAELDPRRSETAWLDGMRGIAAFLVMIFHYDSGVLTLYHEAPYMAPELYGKGVSAVSPPWQIQRLPFVRFLFVSGHVQVSIFFILSGFILAWAPLGVMRNNQGTLDGFVQRLGSLAFRRWFRLFLPCFIVAFIPMLGLYFGVLHMLVPRYDNFFEQIWHYIKACQTFANPFHLFEPGEDSWHVYNIVLWTIPLEWAGSLIVFLTLLATVRLPFRSRVVVVGCISLYACCSAQWHFWLFTAGLLLADCVRQVDGFDNITAQTSSSRFFWLIVLLLGLFLGGMPDKSVFYTRTGYGWVDHMTPSQYKDIENGTRFWWSLASIFITTGAAHFRSIRRALESNIPRYLGRISFMLYLIHNISGEAVGTPLLSFTKNLFGHTVYSPWTKGEVIDTEGPVMTLILYASNMIVLVPIALLLATWLEAWVDAPSTEFARWLERQLL